MEKFLQHYNKEYMKMAILKQEETFKQQVSELHRLYRVQKLLMRDLKVQQNSRTQRTQTQLCHGLMMERPPTDDGKAMQEEIENESDIELTLATGGDGGRRKKKLKNTEDTSDSGAGSPSSSSTMSVGETLKLHEWGLFQSGLKKKMDQSLRQTDILKQQQQPQQQQQPSWHLQCLSLKMT